MLFDISVYNEYILFFTFIFFIGVGLFIFRSKVVSIIDPLTTHIVWIASHLAFLIGYMYKYGASTLPVFFFVNMLIYVLFYNFFLKNNKVILIAKKEENMNFNIKKVKIIYTTLFILNIFSRMNFFKYMIENPTITSWFLYRFKDMEGRDPLLRIISTGTELYLIFYSFLLYAVLKKQKLLVIIFVTIILGLDVLAGSRSGLINVLFILGLCFFYFKNHFDLKMIGRFNKKATVLMAFAVFAAVIVSSFYSVNSTLSDGVGIVTNRFLASGDGLEYYMNYDGLHKIKSGIDQYIYSIFGIYIKRFTGVNYKNVGLQLSELVLGNLEFTQGANYTFLLQTMVIGYPFFFIYVPCVAYFTAKLRAIKFSSVRLLPLSFFLSATSFLVAEDLEFYILNFISGILVFFIVIYPISKITLKKRVMISTQ